MNGRPDIIDMHCDTISGIWKGMQGGEDRELLCNSGHLDLQRLRSSGYLLQNFALFVNCGKIVDPWETVLELLMIYQEELKKNEEVIAGVYCYHDIEANKEAGKLSALLTVEEGAVCKGDIDKLRVLYEKGVRMLTLTWNYPNELGFPNLDANKGKLQGWTPEFFNTPDTENGLTRTGRRFVEEMESLGMIPDVSHLSDAGFYDVLHCTRKLFVASHSNARAICPCVRNMTDEMIRALAERGGVMGLNFCADFLVQKPVGVHNPGTIADIVKHAKHIVNVGGMEVLGLGSDFDGIETHEELVGAQGMEKLYDALVKSGFSQDQADKIFVGNVLRLYRECL